MKGSRRIRQRVVGKEPGFEGGRMIVVSSYWPFQKERERKLDRKGTEKDAEERVHKAP